MDIHIIKSEKFKTIVACLLIRQPLSRDTATLNACIPGILSRGCEKYPNLQEMNMALEKMYGAVFNIQIVKKGEEQIIQFYIECLDKLLGRALEFLAEVLYKPLTETHEGVAFLSEHVEVEKALLKAAIESRINNKADYARLRCLEEMFKDDPFGIYADGYLEDVDAIDGGKAYQQYQRLINESQMDLLILGNAEQNAVQRRVSEIFRVTSYKRETQPTEQMTNEAHEIRRISERHSISQAKLCAGYRARPETCFYDLLVMNEILGGGASSRLFTNVREKEQLCYYINSCVYRFKNIILVQCGADNRSFDRIMELTDSALVEIKKGQFSDAELASARQNLAKKFRAMDDYQTALLDFYISQQMLNDPDSISVVADKISNVTRQGVSGAAAGIWPDTVFTLTPEEIS